jgi:hypothetical protein
MTSLISHTSFDARDAFAQSVFWSQVLSFTEDPDDPNEPGDEECLITSSDQSQRLLFITVPDDKMVKNRVHLDLRPADRTREQEVARIVGLGRLWRRQLTTRQPASRQAQYRKPSHRGMCGRSPGLRVTGPVAKGSKLGRR